MARILFLGDLHGNMTATEAMHAEIKRLNPDVIWFLGDAVGKGPSNDKTCDWVRNNCDKFVAGNWDCMISESFYKHNWPHEYYWNQLGEERILWLKSLPVEESIWISGINFRVIHGRPTDIVFQGYAGDEVLERGLTSSDKNTTYGGMICADSHRPYVRSLHKGYAVNTGSVGNSIGQANAHALLVEGELDSRERSPIYFTVVSVPYDNEKEASIARSSEGMPDCELYCKEVLTGYYCPRV